MALAMLVDKFCKKLQNEFLVNKCSTLLYQCFNSVKRGSSKEIYLVCRLIAFCFSRFLSITIGCKDDLAHKVLRMHFPLFPKLFNISLLDCLAIITFVGGDDLSETERSMQLMWQFFHPKLGNNMVAPTPSAMVLTTALSAWSFLLSTMDVLKVNKSCWKDFECYWKLMQVGVLLLGSTDHDDLSVRTAAAEAIALIFEMGSLEKFCSETKSSNEQLVHEGRKILNQMTNLSLEAGDEVVPKNDSKKKLIDDVLRFLEYLLDYIHEVLIIINNMNRRTMFALKTSIKVGRSGLNISTWSRLLQVFYRPGFVKHMQVRDRKMNSFMMFLTSNQRKKQHISSDNQLLPEMFTCDHEEVVLKNFYQAKQWELEEEEEIEDRQPYQTRNAGHMAVGLEGEDLKDS
ncbi:hypothetical protein MKW92_005317 [Papaver armeniacum]|nr:hypothetical protein MKW92_005317 [Papaver armeniacum]